MTKDESRAVIEDLLPDIKLRRASVSFVEQKLREVHAAIGPPARNKLGEALATLKTISRNRIESEEARLWGLVYRDLQVVRDLL